MSATRIMGVLNVTPDSFSDGGSWTEPSAAVEHGLSLVQQGADIVDVGGESTRPGASRVHEAEELGRVLPVVRELVRHGVLVSIDTMRAGVAAACLDAGAGMVNDVSGGLADPGMPSLAASSGLPFVVTHWRGHSDLMDGQAVYDDVVSEVSNALGRRAEVLVEQGLDPDQIVLDPGFGFAKDAGHNWQLLAGLGTITGLGHRVLVGTSRKRFLSRLPVHAGAPVELDATPLEPTHRDAATAATSLLAAQAGVWAVRVHDVPSTRSVLAVLEMVDHAGR